MKWSAVSRLQTISLFLFICVSCYAAERADTLRGLGEVEVRAMGRSRPRIADDGTVTLDARMATLAPRVMGEADLMRMMLSTAGVSAISDYSSGASVDGMDYSQNLYLLNSVPVEFPYHFGGIFSTFNSAHYPRLTLYKNYHPFVASDCLGGIVLTESGSTAQRRLTGTVNVGMTASSATLRIPARRITIECSGRLSYIDALYKRLISNKSTGVSYGFHDLDLAVTWRPDDHNTLRVFGHQNIDRMLYSDINFAMDTRMRWNNSVAGVIWQGSSTEAGAGFSHLSNHLSLEMPNMDVAVPSSVNRWSLHASQRFAIGTVNCRVGAAAYGVNARPQSVDISGFGNAGGTSSLSSSTRATVTKLYAEADCTFAIPLELSVALEANAFFAPGNYRHTDIDPRIRLTWRPRKSVFSLITGRYHQYVHTVGFSEIGMPSNFKIPASRGCPPQQSLSTALAFSRYIEPGALKINADVYYRHILNQPEYFGGVIDLLQPGYIAEAFIESCSGYNAGGNITLTRDFSRASVSASYSFVIARRHLPDHSEWFTASSDITHSLNISASYRFAGDHWSVSGSWAYATGRPVTPVLAAYFIAERLMVEYGIRNSSRLPAYHRLDLGASYRFDIRRTTNTVSLSVINAYGRRNIEISSYVFNINTGQLRLREVSSLYRFMPSLSYTIEF